MDQNAPENYKRPCDASLKDAETFLEWCASYERPGTQRGLLKAIVTPRFVPTCSMELMKG